LEVGKKKKAGRGEDRGPAGEKGAIVSLSKGCLVSRLKESGPKKRRGKKKSNADRHPQKGKKVSRECRTKGKEKKKPWASTLEKKKKLGRLKKGRKKRRVYERTQTRGNDRNLLSRKRILKGGKRRGVEFPERGGRKKFRRLAENHQPVAKEKRKGQGNTAKVYLGRKKTTRCDPSKELKRGEATARKNASPERPRKKGSACCRSKIPTFCQKKTRGKEKKSKGGSSSKKKIFPRWRRPGSLPRNREEEENPPAGPREEKNAPSAIKKKPIQEKVREGEDVFARTGKK